ncbi:MAG: YifB family Mg chelatase-like AAA ATPase [Clostridia bacterium]|nr:YifB family Mg chelatase-like AAA ATPase [Clostridia bacterium]
MALAKVNSCGLAGIDGYIIDVEADLVQGLPGIDIVGLADTAVKESKERIKSAIKNSLLNLPQRKIIINLAPANTKKEGISLDLPICVAILAASGQISEDAAKDYLILGELALDGSLRYANGVLPVAVAAREMGCTKLLVPYENAPEASVVEGVQVFGARNLIEVVEHFRGEKLITQSQVDMDALFADNHLYEEDFEDVKGQEWAKRALEVAAAGGHNCLMIGSPGSGKTMLAKRLPSILPDMSFDEALEVTKIYSISGKLPPDIPLITKRPFRSPHHTVSSVGLTGGGSTPRPGEISLAHRGVLFLDEFPEFRKDAIEAMRQPIEDGHFTVSRVAGSSKFPSAVMLIASMNPCKCGYYGDPNRECTCTAGQIQTYLGRVSGPMLDRFDLHIEVPAIDYDELSDKKKGEPSLSIRDRVNKARKIQLERYKNSGIYCNAQLTPPLMDKYCSLSDEGQKILKNAFEALGLTARAHNRILKVARTIADLAGSETIQTAHLAEAIQYRSLDKKFWYN